MKKVIFAIVTLVAITGCTGAITGHEYSTDGVEKAWNTGKVVGGAVMTDEQKEAVKPIVDTTETVYEAVIPKN